MGVKVPKEIQEIDLVTLRLRTEGSALARHPWWGGGGEWKEEEPVSKYSWTSLQPWRPPWGKKKVAIGERWPLVEVRLYKLTTLGLPYGFYRKISVAPLDH